jgi:hypothetical protein
MNRHLFLDLEDTVITPVVNGWWNTELINVQRVRAIIEHFKPMSVHLFSFAIWNEAQREQFRLGTKPLIEKALNIKFASEWTVDDNIIPMCCSIMAISPRTVDFQEMSNFWSKHEAFRLSMRWLFRNAWKDWKQENEVLLLDDAVINEEFHWPDLHVRGTIANIDNLPEPLNALDRVHGP